jgi:hypothetical protein
MARAVALVKSGLVTSFTEELLLLHSDILEGAEVFCPLIPHLKREYFRGETPGKPPKRGEMQNTLDRAACNFDNRRPLASGVWRKWRFYGETDIDPVAEDSGGCLYGAHFGHLYFWHPF